MILTPEWIVGFCDGEAAFQVVIHKQKESRRFYVQNSFTIGLGPQDRELLEVIKDFFGVGQLVNRSLKHVRKRGIKSKDQCHYIVKKRKEIMVIDKFFKEHILKSKKRQNFELWSKILAMVQRKRHLQIAGLLEIAKLRDQMKVKTRDHRYRNYEWFLNYYKLVP